MKTSMPACARVFPGQCRLLIENFTATVCAWTLPEHLRHLCGHILTAIAARAARSPWTRHPSGSRERPQHTKLVRPPERGGYGLDALWNDDSTTVLWWRLTGHRAAYYSDYRGTPQEFISTLKWGISPGQRYTWQQQRRGTPAFDLKPQRL